ncbi:hypothetical protein [Bifidobacterium tibiigranuli]|jgi:hypothetical protein|uniref:hypothetical protein n=1 Tax=Bifidobacterium tibiigranuli TaxID=2172043 RepID=UPI0026E9BB0A|nr:hypothetical protein [Bifidobacterium tibiigranuli]MCI1649435.1 hypothetical protein [Bifidobacterium tibiigranuli]MCI2186203.1 hypothetical protein [Bifidobacterium tibiigranuli]MCI2203970.1 hypothetical protein [Bifidobacterium tibiigranuli]
MNEKNRAPAAKEGIIATVLEAAARGLWHLLRVAVVAVAGTALWALALVLLYRWFHGTLWAPLALLGVPVALLAVASVLAPWPRVRLACLFALPVVGDWQRHIKRKARKLGNRWVREAGLVKERKGQTSESYKVYLRKDSLDIDLPVVGVTDEKVRDAVSASLVSWRMADCEITRTGNSSWHVDLFEHDRLDALKTSRVLDCLPPVQASQGHLAVRIGRNLQGDAWLDFSGVSGVLLAGLPGAGKTAAANAIVSGLLSRPDLVDVSVLDGKGGGDWEWCKPYASNYTNDDSYGEALRILHGVQDQMRERLKTNRGKYGDPNLWHVLDAPECDARATCVLIDEIQNWTASPVLDKDTKTKRDEFIGLVTDIAKKGRSACVFLIIATQKPTSDAIPTGLRDVCAKRCAFNVSTPDMAKAALGVIPEGDPDPTAIALEDKGMAVTNTESGGTKYVRFDYLPEPSIERLLSEARASKSRE